MPKFKIIQAEHHAVTYIIEAENEDAAQEAFFNGEFYDNAKIEDDVVASELVSIEAAENT